MSTAFAKHVTFTRTEYGGVVLDRKKGRYWQLNPTAVLVTDTLGEGGSVADAVRRVSREFAVNEQRVQHDVTELLDRLRASGVLRA
ncbi:lasso peptide biosynthesis PqqD family chaperone [Prauserella cavernicola]|uniref:Lasso peptide biosynthesis PqqD family chaperone n=1 Tax=Prauserella cavernicola TaxID=2800127 RepID=A0A934V1R6_9PSEU|nr:lasso peptide biosynthesis PqqD family chaperone [Prauserella cavernicola]MBK1783761.1 lasso peptide biosynthesis PqqD family chaperone [Prauserella cavernicola]